jgi:hypothetical protein
MDYRKIIKDSTETKNKAVGDGLESLLNTDILTDEIKDSIYSHFIEDIQEIISEYLKGSHDKNASKGMLYCTLETWQACVDDIGRLYFKKNNYLVNRCASNGGKYREDLLIIAMEVYEHFCRLYRKQFFIYDCALFLGISRDTIYKLNTTYTDMLKKAHTMQESSMRTALASGRSNVTAMAILLNHDYDYTRTTQVIHTTEQIKSADTLPCLNDEKTLKIGYQNQEKIQNSSEMM